MVVKIGIVPEGKAVLHFQNLITNCSWWRSSM